MEIVRGVAIAAVIAVAGYFAVTKFGWEDTLETLGVIEVTDVKRAAESQCDEAQDLQSGDISVLCLPDRKWGREYIDSCVERESPGLVVVVREHELVEVPTCDAAESRFVQRNASKRVPKNFNVAERAETLTE